MPVASRTKIQMQFLRGDPQLKYSSHPVCDIVAERDERKAREQKIGLPNRIWLFYAECICVFVLFLGVQSHYNVILIMWLFCALNANMHRVHYGITCLHILIFVFLLRFPQWKIITVGFYEYQRWLDGWSSRSKCGSFKRVYLHQPRTLTWSHKTRIICVVVYDMLLLSSFQFL